MPLHQGDEWFDSVHLHMAKTKTSPKKITKPKAKKKATKRKGSKQKVVWDINSKLTMGEELFCRFYVLNEQTRRNGTRSYDAAYDKKLEEQSKDDAVYTTVPSDTEGVPATKKMVSDSSYNRCVNICSTEATKLLRKPNISKRMTELLNEMLGDDFVDGELAKVISQDKDLSPKVRAIQEYNKMTKRTVDTVLHTHAFKKYEDMSDDEVQREIEKGEKFFNKK